MSEGFRCKYVWVHAAAGELLVSVATTLPLLTKAPGSVQTEMGGGQGGWSTF